jgi:Flp pilus assembly protein TadB
VLADARAPLAARLCRHAVRTAVEPKGGGVMSYGIEWTAGPIVLGALLLLLVPGFALIAVIVVALAALAALVALVALIIASPYLLARSLHRRRAERQEATPAGGTQPSGLNAFAEPTAVRG